MKKVQKGFTLVELIVVITILAILGTIAFISLQGYSQDAKNSKVTSDLRTIVSAIETSVTQGDVTLNSVVTGTTPAATSMPGTATFGSGVTFASGGFSEGTINFIALKQNGSDFKDPDGNDYVAAYVADTAQDLVFYQVVGQVRDSAGNFEGVVKGNFIQINSGAGDAAGLVASSGEENATGADAGIIQGEDLGTAGIY